jgi:cellulose synthase/poly-beta-1,6-N-acetylglucosamine synthase-like glycosyltransferase
MLCLMLNAELCRDVPTYCTMINKTMEDLSPLYRLDAIDWTVLILYGACLGILIVYNCVRLAECFPFWTQRHLAPKARATFREENLPFVTIQVPIFNEMYVIERLVKAIMAIDYPRDRFEIQLLDDSTDDTVEVCKAIAEYYGNKGISLCHIHRADRSGFKAGALNNGLRRAKGDFVAIFDADMVPQREFLRRLIHYFTDPIVGCVQMRSSSLNGAYNLLTRLQTIMLDSHLIVEQTTRSRSSGFFAFEPPGIWRTEAIEMSGGWQHDTLASEADLSFRAQLVGWKFIYLCDEETPGETPSEMNAFKAQQRRWTKGEMEVGIKLYPRFWLSRLPWRMKLSMYFRFTKNMMYPVLIVLAFLQFPFLLVRYIGDQSGGIIFLDLLLSFVLVTTFLFHAGAVWHRRVKRISRLLPVLGVIGLEFGLALSNARAVLEALFGVRTNFVRTPKYSVDDTVDDTSAPNWETRQYRIRRGLLPLLELSFAVYLLLAVTYAIQFQMWFGTVFPLFFCIGVGYVGLMSLLQTSHLRRFF